MLFNEPKLLKSDGVGIDDAALSSFSALQRAEIAEMDEWVERCVLYRTGFSAIQRAEIAEIFNFISTISSR